MHRPGCAYTEYHERYAISDSDAMLLKLKGVAVYSMDEISLYHAERVAFLKKHYQVCVSTMKMTLSSLAYDGELDYYKRKLNEGV